MSRQDTRRGGYRAGGWASGPMLLALAIGGLGCSGDDGPKTYPVEGVLRVGGEPAAGAFLVFHPTDGSEERPRAQVGPDGTFRLSTWSEGDGAPAGDYAVTVEWWKLRFEHGEAVPGANVIPPQYTSPEQSPLKVTVIEGENRLEEFQIR
ncbi:hypothetical protein [Tautonia marina]|uniref:hypothetical protein n=1 Tax=Tautonia marina TaxID=2653855 RepID=UPI0012611801|nr:hypothetical protein [Tautonia marina]